MAPIRVFKSGHLGHIQKANSSAAADSCLVLLKEQYCYSLFSFFNQTKQEIQIILWNVPGFKCWQLIQLIFKHCIGKYCVSQTKHICRQWDTVQYLCLTSPNCPHTLSHSHIFLLLFHDQGQVWASWSLFQFTQGSVCFVLSAYACSIPRLLSYYLCDIPPARSYACSF